MQRLLLIAIAALLAVSCRKGPVLPISDDTLVKALADAHLAEAAVQNLAGTYKDSILRVYHEQIYRIHGISETDFRQTVQMLTDQPERMEKLYRKVEKRIQYLQENAKTGDEDKEM